MNPAIATALGAAALFGASTPLAKLLLGDVGPWMLAGLLYLGSGGGLSVVALLRRHDGSGLAKGDGPWLAGAILSGGVIGPVLLMWGLSGSNAASASLLLNAEGVFTALLAWFAFHENFDRRIALGMAAIIGGAVVLSWGGSGSLAASRPALAVLGACLCWGIDNNLTRRVSLSDPVRIAALKGLAAGITNLVLASLAGAALPTPGVAVAAAAVGFFGYGVSLVLFVLALRGLGTARAGAYFSAAPFVGAALAVPLLGEPVSARLAIAGGLMALGLWLHLTERHEHPHQHEPVEHDHPHAHDDPHHHHPHADGADGSAAHSHTHRHSALPHSHPHYPDAHHRHPHNSSGEHAH
ncbi:MAG TPA: DMT family transporter [Patescibacteria group bacterium]|nr:DMT family transporter [Patescibacteria group bacterium]